MKRKDFFHDESMFKGAPASSFGKACSLRERMTEAERLLWERLRNKKFFGYKFRRQHPIHLYIADFYCHKLKLVIEIDGAYHENTKQKESDKKRTEILEYQGIQLIRFKNEEVFNNLESVLEELRKYIPPSVNSST